MHKCGPCQEGIHEECRPFVAQRSEHGPAWARWRCLCDCGTETMTAASDMRRGTTVSCGCYARERHTKHGRTESPEYAAWCGIKTRCNNPNAKEYPYYGGRGIQVCKRWRDSFASFFADMGERPAGRYSIERIDNDGNYEPANCKWATKREQTRNRRNNVRLTYQGETKTAVDWAAQLGISAKMIYKRYHKGKPIADCLYPGRLPRAG